MKLFSFLGLMGILAFSTVNAQSVETVKYEALHDKIANYKDQVVVVNFWATWCPPCQKEMGEFQSFQEAHPEVALHLVSLGETPDEIRTFFQEESLNLEAVIDPTGKGVQLYRVQAIPTTLVVNSKGIIVLRKVGPITKKELEHALRN